MRVRYRAPVSVFLNVTYRCNLACVYCSARASAERQDDLGTEELKRLVSDVIESRVCKVIITGGEPFVRPDVFGILERLRQARVLVQINTNGTRLDRAACERLRDLGVHRISVSLDGTRDHNDATRGPGSFDSACRGVRNLLDVGIRPNILLTLTRRNAVGLRTMVDECRGLGVATLSIGQLSPMGRAAENPQELGLSAAEWHAAAETIRELEKAFPSFVYGGFLGWREYPRAVSRSGEAAIGTQQAGQRHFLPCDAAKTFCAITAEGWVVPCNKFDTYKCGNMREESLLSIWNGKAMDRIRRLATCPVTQGATCAKCCYSGVCSGGCRAEAYRAFGELDAPDPGCSVLADSAVHSLSAIVLRGC